MMKFSLAVICALALPAAVSAIQAGAFEAGTQTQTNATSTRTGIWCDRVADITTLGNERLKVKQDEWQGRRSEIKSRFEIGRKYRDSEIARVRKATTEKREEHFRQWENRATTSEQQAAVGSYEAAVEAAVAKRQAAIDKAIAEQRTGIDRIKAERESRFDGIRKSYDEAVAAAIAKAKSSCEGGGASAAVQNTFRSEIKAARTKFAADVKTMERDQAGIDALKKSRREVFDAAIAAFQAEMKTARNELKTAFGMK